MILVYSYTLENKQYKTNIPVWSFLFIFMRVFLSLLKWQQFSSGLQDSSKNSNWF